MLPRSIKIYSVLCFFVISSCLVDGWSYLDIDDWYKSNPACGSTSQSPINLHPDQSIDQDYRALQFINYNHIIEYTEYDITNLGHTVVVSFTYNNKSVSITGGGLPERYALQQFHFHWGNDKNKGSEHSVNGGYYPMEMHLVHYNATYNEYGAATSVHDGLAVLGVFVQLSDEDNPALEYIVKYLNKVKYQNEHANVKDKFYLKDLLPGKIEEFYRYEGSLTTPPCYSSVIWTVFRYPITISQRQLYVFRSLHEHTQNSTEPDDMLVNNFRPPQPLHDRPVYRTFNIANDWSYADTTKWSMLYPMCGGSQQSPIALNSRQAQVKQDWEPLWFSGYSVPSSATLQNTGHSVEIQMTLNTSRMTVSGGGLQGTYVLYQINFLWESFVYSGSEHKVDKLSYPLEIQLLHFNSRYGDRMNASQHADGFAAFSVLGETTDDENQVPLIDNITSIQFPGESVQLDAFKARSLLPDNTLGYYRYNGSLTSPECSENVIWTVFTNKLSVSARELIAWRKNLYITPSQSTQKILMAGRNKRPIQPDNNRTVLLIQPWGSTVSAASPLADLDASLQFIHILMHTMSLLYFSAKI
jgi:carbonic anhydrase